MSKSESGRGGERENASSNGVEWEMRPGGMLVQKREDGSSLSGPMIYVKVCYRAYQLEVAVPAQSTFGELKRDLVRETGLKPHEQRLLFRGKERGNEEYIHMVGVKDMSKLILLEDPASMERKLEEMNKNQEMLKACEAISTVREEVTKLSGKVSLLEAAVYKGTKVANEEFVLSTELLMRHLLKLDSIEAAGEAKVQRKIEVRRVQSLVDTLDSLKERNSRPFSNCSIAVTVPTQQWETFDSGMGSLSAPPPNSSSKITKD